MAKTQKKVKIWFIERDGTGYWTENPDWIWEFKEMGDGESFTIKCQELTLREYNKFQKTSHEFEGW